MITNFPLAVVVLAALLFFPLSRLVWVLSIRRLERKAGRKLDQAELDGQRRRARIIAVLLAVPFSYLFNLSMSG